METGVASVRGVELAWERSGAGTPVVWGHGLSSSRADENDFGLVDHVELAAAHDLIRYDARGHGASTASAAPEASAWDQMALDQLELLHRLGVDRYMAGGASLGAATAIHAAVLSPERVQRLVLVIPPTAWETRSAQTELYGKMADIVEAKGVAPLVDGLVAAPVPDPLAGDDRWLRRRTASLEAADPTRLARSFRGARHADLPPRAVVATIEAPTLILAWTGDPGHPVSTAHELQDLVPNSQAHYASTATDLAGWTQILTSFLAS